MSRQTVWLMGLSLAVGGLVWFWLAGPATTQGTAVVSGAVVDLISEAPIPGATVRQKTTANVTTSGAGGAFSLGDLPEGISVTVTAWYTGYLVGWATVTPPQTGVTITLQAHYTEDNPAYAWFSSNGPIGEVGCVHCMGAHPQWQANAHGNSATNPRFFSLYNGTVLTTTAVISPGYKLDYPGTAGNCSSCHAPTAAAAGIGTPFTGTIPVTSTTLADMNALSGVDTEGVFCEFCHKVGDVYVEPDTGLPHEDRPGVFSMRLYRSPPGGVLFYGPFDDVTRRVSYLPLEKEGRFCASCHQASFYGTPIYESFREWLESPYPAQGVRCQTCHMTPTGVDYFVYPGMGGLIRDPALIASHLQPGASDVPLLQNTVSMTLSARPVANSVQVAVTIANTGAGHHVPTDHPGRHLILAITATNSLGQVLAQQDGPTVPAWGGAQAGLPGTAFAKVLRDEATGEAPVVSYWKPTTILSDTRIPALASDTSTYTFAAPAAGPVTVTAELRFRRLFQPLLDDKGWGTPDIVMEEQQIRLWRLYLPLAWKG